MRRSESARTIGLLLLNSLVRMRSPTYVIVAFLYTYGKALLYGCYVAAMLAVQQILSPTRNLFKVRPREAPPKCLLDKELGQHGYVTVKGLKFHYVEKGDKTKPLMLFVHGFPEFWYSWRHQMKEFSKNYWTVAVDMRGYGDSEKPKNVSSYGIDLLVDDIKGIVTGLGKKTFILVAHDWGAAIAWVFVDKYPEMVDKYIMMNGSHPKIHGKMMMTKSQSAKSWYIYFFQLPVLPELWVKWNDLAMFSNLFLAPKTSNPHVTEEDIEAFKYTFSKPGAITPPIHYYRAALRSKIFGGGVLKKSDNKKEIVKRPPGLYIFGAKDIAIDSSSVSVHKELYENLETLVILEGNHFVQQDEPKAVNNAINSFLK